MPATPNTNQTTETADAEKATRELERTDQRWTQRRQDTRTEAKNKEKPREEKQKESQAISPTSDMNRNIQARLAKERKNWPAFVTLLLTPRSQKSGYGLLLGC